MLLLWALACGPADGGDRADTDTADTAGTDTADTADTGPCPGGMVHVSDFCIDAFEATVDGDLGDADQIDAWPGTTTTAVARSEQGVLPTVPLSWYQARGACLNAGKHLCTVTEWQAACGEGALPWGDAPPPEEVCAVPAPDGSTAWDALQPTGSLPDCRSPAGVYDQIGNAWEWADPGTLGPDTLPTTAKMGGAYYSGQGNASCAVGPFTDHVPSFAGTIAARCCVAAR